MQQKTSKLFPESTVNYEYGTSRMPPPGGVAATTGGSVTTPTTEHVTRSRALLMKYPGGAFAYRHPRAFASAESAVGIWLVILGVILCSYGY
jgi:hypothetical protein